MAFEFLKRKRSASGQINLGRRNFLEKTLAVGAVGAAAVAGGILSQEQEAAPRPKTLEERNTEIGYELTWIGEIGPKEAAMINDGKMPPAFQATGKALTPEVSAQNNVRFWLQTEFIDKKRFISQSAIDEKVNDLLRQQKDNKDILQSAER